MKVASEFGNVTPVSHLGTRKLFALLDIPQDDREDFLSTHHYTSSGKDKTVEEMTTREVEKVKQMIISSITKVEIIGDR